MPESTSAGPEPAPFATKGELRRAFADPRFAPTTRDGRDNPAHDPAYKAAVLQRMAATAPALEPGGGGLPND